MSTVLCVFFFFSSRRRHPRCSRDWSSDVCSSDLKKRDHASRFCRNVNSSSPPLPPTGPQINSRNTLRFLLTKYPPPKRDRKSTRLNSSHGYISYAVFCLKKKKIHISTDYATLSNT